MLIVDLLIVALTVAVAYWGYRQGLSTGALVLVGFGGGAILGSRVGPLFLDGGLEDPFAPVVALPAALLIGALFAAALERVGFGLRRRLRRRDTPDAIGGAVLAACIGLVAVWVLGALAARVDGLRGSVRDSVIIDKLNAVLPPPGPLLNAAKGRTDPLPVIAGPDANVGPARPGIKRDPQVRSAASSVVRLIGSACGHGLTGSGWIARDGVVVTNAHVIQGSDNTRVMVEGNGHPEEARAIWYDRVNDIAVLRAPGISGAPALQLDPKPKPGTYAAALGFPGGGAYQITPARVGNTSRIPAFRLRRGDPTTRRITSMRAALRPGNSGGPVVDERRRVVTTAFAARVGGRVAYGVPNSITARALRRAGPPVDTGPCRED